MKKFVAALAMLFVTVLAIWVAFRLAPETWAMIAGIVFGIVATLPMCAIVLVLLLRGHGRERRPAEPAYYPPPQPMAVLNAEPGPYGHYWVEAAPPPMRRLPADAPQGRRRPATQALAPGRPFVDRAQGPYTYPSAPARYAPAPYWDGQDGYEEWEEAGDVPVDPYGAWEQPAPPPVRHARILGRP